MGVIWGSVLLVVGAAVVLTQISAFVSSIYLHRGMAHRALAFHPVADVVFRAIIWLMVGVSRQQWVAVHRKHHTYTDVPGDPHSPRVFGFWQVQFGNFFYYLREARRPEVLATWGADLPPDRWDRWVFSRHVTGLVVGTGLLVLVFGWWLALAIAAAHAVLDALIVVPLVNALTHWRGQKNFDNTAYNIRALVWVTAGEALHNNHHARPRSAKLSLEPGEHDLAWPVIRGLERLGIVSAVRQH